MLTAKWHLQPGDRIDSVIRSLMLDLILQANDAGVDLRQALDELAALVDGPFPARGASSALPSVELEAQYRAAAAVVGALAGG